ncbi:MAG: hypothetical protein K6G56_08430 [Clostridiales bacterium]|nr:hypothetical protein [Clostridiales bacterium]
MKKIVCIILAALMALAFAGCRGNKSGDKNKPNVTPKPTARIADGSGYDNSVTITDGIVERGDFNWRFFLSKIAANMNGSVTVKAEGREYKIAFSAGSFSVDDGDAVSLYKHLLTFTEELPEGSEHASVEYAILTDDPEMTTERFFGGATDGIKVGMVREGSLLIFMKYEDR